MERIVVFDVFDYLLDAGQSKMVVPLSMMNVE